MEVIDKMKKIFSKNYKDEEKKKDDLKKIIAKAEKIIKESEGNEYLRHPIFDFIKPIINKLQTDLLYNLYISGEYLDSKYNLRNILPYRARLGGEDFLEATVSKVEGSDMKISLRRDNIITAPWNFSRFVNTLCNIGNSCPWGDFIEDKSNHFVDYYYPLGIFVVWGGNHSINSGILKSEGEIGVRTEYDLRKSYEYVYFDGVNYKYKETGCIIPSIGEVIFEFGVIYEIGRLILNNNIKYE